MSETSARSAEGPWVDVAALADLVPGSLRTVKHGARALVLVRTAAGEVHALDNRCPHEGYPLQQGELEDCTLTCAWHNWKFDVRDGRCLLGGEGVASWPTRVVDGRIEVELREPDLTTLRARAGASLGEALQDGDVDRALRDAARLLQGDHPPAQLLADVARHDATHYEWGLSHVLALAADSSRALRGVQGTSALPWIAPTIDLCAESTRRMPRRAVPVARPGADFASLQTAVEARDVERSESLLRGVLEAPSRRPLVEGWLYRLVGDHFLDFGHPLIYLTKAQDLLDQVGEEPAADLLSGLLVGIVYATREDTLPYFRTARERWQATEAELPDLHQRARGVPVDHERLRAAVLGTRSDTAVDAVSAALRAGSDPEAVGAALVRIGAEEILRFDESIDRRADVEDGWLWITHRFTFACAARIAQRRFPRPEALRFLGQAAAFLQQATPLLEAARPEAARAFNRGPESDAQERAEHVLADAGLASTPNEEAARVLLDRALHLSFERPIFHAHGIKVATAAIEEAERTQDAAERRLLLGAAQRFLASRPVQKNLGAQVQRALDTVLHGRPPKRLSQ